MDCVVIGCEEVALLEVISSDCRAGPTAAVMSTARMPAPLLGQSSQMNPPGPPGMGYPGVNPNINPNMNPNVNPYPTGVNLTNQLGPVGSGLPPHSLAALTSE